MIRIKNNYCRLFFIIWYLQADYNKSITKKIVECFTLDKLYEYKNLKSISFENNFNKTIKKGDLPESLLYLSFGHNFTNRGIPIKKGDLPAGLQSLVFGDRFIKGGKPVYGNFPEGLLYLSFGDKFSNGGKPINGQLPNCLKSLLFDT
jgi:hypothetical protein